jgi:hypothetical protein
VFERYDLLESNSNSNNNNESYFNSTITYYYDNINNQEQQQQQKMESSNLQIKYPLSLIDAVNKKQLDLETGLFKSNPQSSKFDLSLNEALQRLLLNHRTAYLVDSTQNTKTYDLSESVRLGLITKNNRVLISSTFTLSLADALKIGHLKIGEPSAFNLKSKAAEAANSNSSNSSLNSNSSANSTSSSSVSSETQSMSVKSIKDPRTNEYLAPTDAIKRNLLDPYKGVFLNPLTGQQMPISDAIQEGYVLVELIPSNKHQSSSSSSQIVSTSLIRETKSYHLLAVLDTTRNQEISIKEAIQKGILDRQRGIYINPLNRNEFYSISDAIQKGFIRARILTPPLSANSRQQQQNEEKEEHYHQLVSTNRFEENKTFTIRGAIDTKANMKELNLKQAINQGILDVKTGKFLNTKTGETMSINKAIELNLVLTDSSSTDYNNNNNQQVIKQKNGEHQQNNNNKEIRTLSIELIKDPRTGREISVGEAIKLGLFNSQTLTYYNPLTNEYFNLNRAYEKGFILGHYNVINNSSNNNSSQKHEEKIQKSYFIVDVLDPSTNRVLNLDQAIKEGLFDYKQGKYCSLFIIRDGLDRTFRLNSRLAVKGLHLSVT